MKKMIFAIVLLAGLQVSAQYKKASFFNKAGRTVDFGITSHIKGNSSGSPLGIYLGWGMEGKKRFFRYSDITFIPKYKFTCTATGIPIGRTKRESFEVSGTRTAHLGYNFNVGYFVTDNADEDKKLQGYVSLGTGFIFGTDPSYSTDYYSYSDIEPALAEDPIFKLNLHGSVGGIYKFSEVYGLKLDVGYSHLFGGDNPVYGAFKSHPYISLGIRIKVREE